MPDGKQRTALPRPHAATLAVALLALVLAGRVATAATLVLERAGSPALRARVWCAAADTATARAALQAALTTAGDGTAAAIDRATEVLRARGITRAEVHAGTVTRWLGADHEWWVAHPQEPELAVVELRGGEGALAFTPLVRSADGRARVQVGVWAREAAHADSLARTWTAWERDRAGAIADSDDALGVLWLEPYGARVRVVAWDLECIGFAPCADREPPPVPVPAAPPRIAR